MRAKFILTFICGSALAGVGTAQTTVTSSAGKTAAVKASAGDQAYNEGTTALNEGKFQLAVDKFDFAAKQGGARAPGALYWKAYALYKMGRRKEAEIVLAGLTRSYPQSRWLNDAKALRIEMRDRDRDRKRDNDNDNDNDNDEMDVPDSPEPPEPPEPAEPVERHGRSGDPDDDLRLLALNQVMERDPARAIPLIEKFLQGSASRKMKEHAMFVLAQSSSPAAKALITKVARGEVYPDIQTKAIQNLAIAGNRTELRELYKTVKSEAAKRAVLEGFIINGDTEGFALVARAETDPGLQKKAVQGLGINGARGELRKLYQETKSNDVKRYVLDAMIIAGDADGFAEIARTDPDPEIRLKAIRGIGISGGKRSEASLLGVWNANPDRRTRKAVLEALFIAGNSKALVELARKETDPDMKRSIVEKISIMGGKEATDYMLELLNK